MPHETFDPGELRALAYPDHFSLAEQNDARVTLQALIGQSEVEIDQERRERELAPVLNVADVGTDDAD